MAGYNTASIVLQVPISEVRQSAAQPVIGVWASADRREPPRRSRRAARSSGPGRGSRSRASAIPLINEVIIPRHLKDYWNGQHPSKDSQFLKYYEAPELAGLINFLYPALAGRGHDRSNRPVAHPAQGRARRERGSARTRWPPTCCGSTPRSCPASTGRAPAARPTPAKPDRLAVLAADLCGFPNGRRLVDDVTDIELRAIAQGYGTFLNGAFGLPNKSPNNQVGDGVDSNADMPFLGAFPYIGLPHSGYESVPPLKGMLP